MENANKRQLIIQKENHRKLQLLHVQRGFGRVWLIWVFFNILLISKCFDKNEAWLAIIKLIIHTRLSNEQKKRDMCPNTKIVVRSQHALEYL